MKDKLRIPPSILRAAKRAKVPSDALVEWLLSSLDDSLVKDAAKNFKKLLDRDGQR